MSKPLFFIGQCIQHNKFNYRGVIFDADAAYTGSDEWYEQVALSRPPKDKPWYHVLVDGSTQITYVAERHLQTDSQHIPVNHPFIEQYFESFDNGVYKLRQQQ